MAKVIQLRGPARVREQAALWLARLDKGLGSEERAELRAWLAEDPSHRNAFLELASLWDELDVLAELSELFPLEQPVRAVPHRGRWLLAGSAAVLVVAALVGYELRFTIEEQVADQGNRVETFETTVGGHATQQLSDGSVITLNTDTEIGVAFVEQSRDVYLRRGEAHFDVAHAAQPFRVHVGNQTLEAVGTAFNVHLRPDGDVELTVTEGSVRVTKGTQADLPAGARPELRSAQAPLAPAFDATVVEGELAILDESAASGGAQPQIMRLEPADMDARIAWQRGMLIFRGEPLPQMLDEIARYTTAEFVLAGDELNDVRVGGYFRAGDVDGLLLALRENFQIESERLADNRIVLRAEQAPE
jgi:transmembrane sensor